MSRTRTWAIGAVVGSLLLLVASWFLLIQPQRSQAAELTSQTEAQVSANAQLRSQIVQLQAQAKDLPQQEAALAKIRQRLPLNPALPGLVRTLSSVASTSGVSLDSLAPATPQPLVPPTQASAATGTTTTGSGDAAATPAPAPTVPGSNVQVVGVDVRVTGSFFDVEQFINKVEGLTRSMMITGFTIKPAEAAATGTGPAASTDGEVTATIQARVFYSPPPAAAAAPTTPAQ